MEVLHNNPNRSRSGEKKKTAIGPEFDGIAPWQQCEAVMISFRRIGDKDKVGIYVFSAGFLIGIIGSSMVCK